MSGGVMERLLESTTLTCDQRVEELMGVGDLIAWRWYLDTGWEKTNFSGVVVGSRMAKTDHEKVRIFQVLASDGTVLEVREDADGLELVS
jgi:hypothetical protein